MCFGVTCHLHFWQNDRGLLRATAVTRGWNRHRIRVSTQSGLWRINFSRRSCSESNSQPFDHESGALTNKLSLPLTCHVIIYHTGRLSAFRFARMELHLPLNGCPCPLAFIPSPPPFCCFPRTTMRACRAGHKLGSDVRQASEDIRRCFVQLISLAGTHNICSSSFI